MKGRFQRLASRYGQQALVCYADGQRIPVRAFLRPVRYQNRQYGQSSVTALGMKQVDRFLYLGPPEVELPWGEDCFLESMGRKFDLQAAEPIYVGERISHWWALLVPRDDDDDCLMGGDGL